MTISMESETSVSSLQRPKVQEILMLHHSHLDLGYTHSQPILWELQNSYIGEAMDWLERTADQPGHHQPKWTCEATEPVHRWLARASQTDRERFQTLVAQGRIGLAALRWNTAAAIDRAGLQRLVDGKRELEDLTGAPIRVACQHDVNGVPWAMADVLIDAGVDLFVMAINTHLGKSVQPRPGMFMWEAPSGRAIRVFNGHHYTMFDQLMLAWDDSVDQMEKGWTGLDSWLDGIGYNLDFMYLTSTYSPVMWDNAPPNPFLPDLLRRWNEADRGPTVRYATFDDLRARVLQVPEESIPRLRGDWTDYWSFGYGSTPIATSLNQRAKPLAAAARAVTATPEEYALTGAEDRLDYFDEHTWGYYNNVPEHPQHQTGDIIKQVSAHEAHELASYALMHGLDQLAGNPVSDKGTAGILLANPTDRPLRVRPTVPKAWIDNNAKPATERTARASRMFYHNRPWGSDRREHEAFEYGLVEVPAQSWRTIPFDELPDAPDQLPVVHSIEVSKTERRGLNFMETEFTVVEVGKIESPFHTLMYNPVNGRILSLVDRRQRKELLDPRDGMDFFSFVRERPDALEDSTREAYYISNLEAQQTDISAWRDWDPIRERATRVISCTVEEKHDRVTLVRTFEAPGASHFVQHISFLADDPVIHLEVEIELTQTAAPQAIYLAFPLALQSGWRASFDTAGDIIGLDEDQLPGSCRGWVTAESMAAMWDEETAVALFVPDAPGVQFGDFHFGPPIDSVPRPENPLLLGWPINSYWGTNFPHAQPGRMRFRYGFLSLPASERDEFADYAAAFRMPSLVWPVTTGGRGAAHGTLPGRR